MCLHEDHARSPWAGRSLRVAGPQDHAQNLGRPLGQTSHARDEPLLTSLSSPACSVGRGPPAGSKYFTPEFHSCAQSTGTSAGRAPARTGQRRLLLRTGRHEGRQEELRQGLPRVGRLRDGHAGPRGSTRRRLCALPSTTADRGSLAPTEPCATNSEIAFDSSTSLSPLPLPLPTAGCCARL